MGKKKQAVSKKSTPSKSEKSKAIKKTKFEHHTKDQKHDFLKSYNEKLDTCGFSTRAIHYG